MTQSKSTLHFNALTDAWLPLLQRDGTTLMASPVEVLVGEKDGVDLDFPRDDFRVYARLLLSALVQALFPAKTKAEFLERLDRPLARADVEGRIRRVLPEFDLFGSRPFLQVTPPADLPNEGAAPFVFPGEDLFRSRTQVEAISLPIALISIFIEQTYAGGAGRGYGAGPAGQPGALTLVDPGSVRAAAWANTISSDRVAQLYAPEGKDPWSNEVRKPQPRASIGLIAGLFFQPRAVWLIPAGEGRCSFTGRAGPLVRMSPLRPKSTLTKKASGKEDLWQHPCAPLAVNSQGIAAIRLSAERPVWTGLAQLLQPLSRAKTRKAHPREGPAPVLEQWKTLPRDRRPHRLLVLDFDRDKANVKGRFFEGFPLTEALLSKPVVVEHLRAMVDDAEAVARALGQALSRAHDDRKHGGLALPDAVATFWASSERPFLDWLATLVKLDPDAEDDEPVLDASNGAMRDALRRSAMTVFDAHVELSEFDPRKQERIAVARRRLRGSLFPRLTAQPTPTAEVTP